MRRTFRSALASSIPVLAMVAAAVATCIEPKPRECTFSGNGYRQGQTTACETGWRDAPGDGLSCRHPYWRKGKCNIFKDCAPHPCSQQPQDRQPTFSAPSDGQCCSCKTFVETIESDNQYYFYDGCDPCVAGPN